LLLHVMVSSITSIVHISYSCSGLSLFLHLIGRDEKGRLHFMEIQLDIAYPKSPPSVSAVGLL